MTLVTWRLKGQKTERQTSVPDGEFYVDWIGQQWAVDPKQVEILNTENQRWTS